MDTHVLIAKRTVEYFVRTARIPSVENAAVIFEGAEIPPIKIDGELLSRRAGTFSTIHTKEGELRGCIGTIAATQENIAREIVRNAVCACSQDSRFDPVREDELEGLEYSVDVLGELEEISGPEQLDVKRYGVIVTSEFRRGLLLPNLEGVDDAQTQISIARRKGGIPEAAPIQLERFEVVRHK